MVIKLNQCVSVLGLIGSMVRVSSVLGAPGDVLLEYQASSGLLPEDFGWQHEGRSLDENCPFGENAPTCDWYGAIDNFPCDSAADNDGSVSPTFNASGCPDGFSRGSAGGHFTQTEPVTGSNNNAPAPLFEGYDQNYAWVGSWPYGGVASYNEWIEFDDDGDNLEHIGTAGQHPKTPKGAGEFPGAPAYQTLRLVGGDGNGIAASTTGAGVYPNSNYGKIKIKAGYSESYSGPITLVFRAAFSEKGPDDRTDRILEFEVMKSDGSGATRFAFFYLWDNSGFGNGAPCEPGDASNPCGQFGITNDGPELMPALGATDTQTFVTFRAACSADTNECTIWVNEDVPCGLKTSALPVGYVPNVRGPSRAFRWGLISTGDYTLWTDFIQVLEGIVPPVELPCDECQLAHDPVFDVTSPGTPDVSDGKVDESDLTVFSTECYTGPAPAAGVFDALSDRCKCMDLNGDFAIDHEDFGRFQVCYSGGDQVDPICDGN